MKTYETGQPATYGVYASAWPPDLCVVSADGDALAGKDGVTYRRLPLPLVVAAGPILGGMFVLTFPLLVLAAVATVVAQVVRDRVRAVRESHAHLVRLRWEPATSFLRAGEERDEDDHPVEPETDDELDDLEDEIRTRREAERR